MTWLRRKRLTVRRRGVGTRALIGSAVLLLLILLLLGKLLLISLLTFSFFLLACNFLLPQFLLLLSQFLLAKLLLLLLSIGASCGVICIAVGLSLLCINGKRWSTKVGGCSQTHGFPVSRLRTGLR